MAKSDAPNSQEQAKAPGEEHRFVQRGEQPTIPDMTVQTYANQAGALAARGQEAVPELVRLTFETAVNVQASDVHFDPFRDGLCVRFRVGGVLHHLVDLPKPLAMNVVRHCQNLARLLTHRSSLPQEGYIRREALDMPYNFRMATYPTYWGECASIRIFGAEPELRKIDELGFPDHVTQALHDSLVLQDGLILLSGPAGSGKTTTLYAALHHIVEESKATRRVATIEDPVENVIDGVMQTEVNRRVNLDFERALRSILRHDVGVIMVGEIRDTETAMNAVEASLTGHLVLSTVHAGRAYTVPYRLLEMGVPPYALSGGIQLVIAERLVRELREERSRPLTEEESSWLPQAAREGARTVNGKKYSPITAYAGRFALAEKLATSEDLRRAIMEQATLSRFREIASQEGEDLPGQALRAVREGRTTWREVLRVLAGERGLEHGRVIEPAR